MDIPNRDRLVVEISRMLLGMADTSRATPFASMGSWPRTAANDDARYLHTR